ncbi:P44-36 outer membrane protein [Anaplasma phagocytophilum]|uniref:p44-36 outer membrane protein n=1 Tax=Anaplasma phagocytophilum TaxID=948 RepID=A0A098GJG6_ANAPH|nr:P44-36 outer membrane protein [Anaplasma phagocytophilum]
MTTAYESLAIPKSYVIILVIKSKTKGIRDSGSKEDEADTVYLLAKELAYDVVSGQTDKLTAALAKTSGKDFVKFANAVVGISHPNIGKKVCATKRKSDSGSNHYATYGEATENVSTGSNKKTVAVCGAAAENGNNPDQGGVAAAEVLGDFVRVTLKGDGSKNWPTSKAAGERNGDNPPSKTNDNAEAVAKDLTKLTTEEKTIVAGLLAKTIEGGEVVEIRAVSSTSVRN